MPYLNDHPYLQLNDTCNIMSQTLLCIFVSHNLIVNIFEVNSIIKSYLEIWDPNLELSFITCEKLKCIFCNDFDNLIDAFFPSSIYINGYNFLYIDQVKPQEYFLFVCSFIFFPISQVISLLLSICRVYSNVFVKKEQMNQILKIANSLPLTEADSKALYFQSQTFVADCPADTYSIKIFNTYLKSLFSFNVFINSLKEKLTNIAIGYYEYEIIQKRRTYLIMNPFTDNIPPESCKSYLYRKLFTHSMPPYHFDYILPSENSLNMENMLLIMKRYFGYAYRMKNSQPTLHSSSNLISTSSSARSHSFVKTSNSGVYKRTQHSKTGKTTVNMSPSKIVPL